MIGKNEPANSISLYFHVPFCTQKCAYCHFYVVPDKEPLKATLMEGLLLEWERYSKLYDQKTIQSIYFGGGTPYLFGADRISQLLQRVQQDCQIATDAEVTLEANPENIDAEGMEAYRKAGINRVSIGVQSFHTPLLNELGRLHSKGRAEQAVSITHQAGIRNISIDLMYDLPDQNLDTWRDTLHRAIDLPITHLSLYNLTLEPHTVFYKHRDSIAPRMPEEDLSAAMYESALEILPKGGLSPYEISAFAKKGQYSVHNTGYWLGRPFLGLGPSAFSYWDGKRFRNVSNLHRYTRALKNGESPVDFEESLDERARRRELLLIALRMRQGVDLFAFQEKWGPLDDEVLRKLSELEVLKLIEHVEGKIRPSDRGVLLYDAIGAEIC